MTEVTQYKCPACGGAMEFDSASQNLKCPYCDTEFDINEFTVSQQQEQSNDDSSNRIWTEDEASGMHVYVCESCGGEIIADDTTGATSCPFCGNRVVMKGQFSGDLKPDYIIPFKFNKKQAKEAYLKHIDKKPFLPKVFKAQNHIDEIKGVYVPFWLFDFLMDTHVSYDATDIRTWTSGKTHYTETKYYEGAVSGRLNFNRIAQDATTKMDDDLMESIEPFDFNEAVPFKPAYLAGYLADRYDVELDDRMNRARERADASSQDIFMTEVNNHDTITKNNGHSEIMNASYLYALYPVWILNTTWNNEHFIFAMNGQNGHMVGNLPADMKQFWLYILTRGLIFSIVAFIVILIFFML